MPARPARKGKIQPHVDNPIAKSEAYVAQQIEVLKALPRNGAMRAYSAVELVAACRAEGMACLERLKLIRDDDNTSPAIRAAAAVAIWDRGYGKPHQSVAISDARQQAPLDATKLTMQELLDLERLLAKAGSGGQPGGGG